MSHNPATAPVTHIEPEVDDPAVLAQIEAELARIWGTPELATLVEEAA